MFLNETLWSSVTAVLLAVAGGLARQLTIKDKKLKQVKPMTAELFVAFFAGVIMLFFALETGISGYWIGIVCGIGGWTSPNILHFITRVVEKVLGAEKDELSGRNDTSKKQ